MPGGIVAKGTYPNEIDKYTSQYGKMELARLIFSYPSAQMVRLRQGQSSPSMETMIQLEALTGVPIQDLYKPYWEGRRREFEEAYRVLREGVE